MKLIDKIMFEALELDTQKTYKLSEIVETSNGFIQFFNDENHEEIKIYFEFIPPQYVQSLIRDISPNAKGYNLVFTVNENPYQSFKSTYSYYIKILATVMKATEQFVKEEEPDFLIIGSSSMDSLGDKKNKVYDQIINKATHKLSSNYGFSKINAGHLEGYLIQKRLKYITK